MNNTIRERLRNMKPSVRYRGAHWGVCAGCYGALPMIDGDNAHWRLPRSRRRGACPEFTTDGGACGAYSDCDLAVFARFADAAPREIPWL